MAKQTLQSNDNGAESLIKINSNTDELYTAISSIEEKTDNITNASASNPTTFDFSEDTDNGTNKITVTAPSSIASDKIITLPDATGTVALVDTILAAIYPVGSIFVSGSATMPTLISDLGTWTRIEGRFIVGASDSDGDFDNGDTGGNKTKDLSHIHTMPTHYHKTAIGFDSGEVYGLGDSSYFPFYGSDVSTGHRITVSVTGTSSSAGVRAARTENKDPGDTNSGGSSTQDILPPYKAKYMWERTA